MSFSKQFDGLDKDFVSPYAASLPYPSHKHVGRQKFTKAIGFGDSISTKGAFGGATLAGCWRQLMEDYLVAQGLTVTGEGYNGAAFPGFMRAALVQTPLDANTLVFGMPGFNEITRTGMSLANQEDYDSSLRALLLWSALPETALVRATTIAGALNPAVTRTGTWNAYASLATNFAATTSATGGTMTFTTPPGTNVYVFFGRRESDQGHFTVSIDGGPAVPVSGQQSYAPAFVAESGNYCAHVAEFRGLADAAHTVTLTVTGVYPIIYAVAAVNPRTTVGPTVVIASTLYTSYGSTQIDPGAVASPQVNLLGDGAIRNQNTRFKAVVDRLAAEGFLVYHVDVTSGYSVALHAPGDQRHPQDPWHRHGLFARMRSVIEWLQGLRSAVP